MLAGTKPLAMFYDDNGEPDERIIPEREFDAYVRPGLFVKGTRVRHRPEDRQARANSLRLVRLKPEEWRVNAMFRHGPDEAIERMTSSLLGYSDEEFKTYSGAYCARIVQSMGT